MPAEFEVIFRELGQFGPSKVAPNIHLYLHSHSLTVSQSLSLSVSLSLSLSLSLRSVMSVIVAQGQVQTEEGGCSAEVRYHLATTARRLRPPDQHKESLHWDRTREPWESVTKGQGQGVGGGHMCA